MIKKSRLNFRPLSARKLNRYCFMAQGKNSFELACSRMGINFMTLRQNDELYRIDGFHNPMDFLVNQDKDVPPPRRRIRRDSIHVFGA